MPVSFSFFQINVFNFSIPVDIQSYSVSFRCTVYELNNYIIDEVYILNFGFNYQTPSIVVEPVSTAAMYECHSFDF